LQYMQSRRRKTC